MQHKPKWRWIGGKAHCFIKGADVPYLSLCERHTLDKAYGGSVRRPPAWMRCGRCDGLEMDLLGWDESGPETANWQDGCP
ncbi:MAG: hypothetical protein GTN93_26060 [Anaerolineae bacterium]|nr:hypothetical protein [Anaerolineae bacterium]